MGGGGGGLLDSALVYHQHAGLNQHLSLGTVMERSQGIFHFVLSEAKNTNWGFPLYCLCVIITFYCNVSCSDVSVSGCRKALGRGLKGQSK